MAHISIIIPCYNGAQFIERTLESVRLQSQRDIEVILIDDCSTDHSSQVIEQYLQKHSDFNVKLLKNEKNQGVSITRNRGIEDATGEYIAFLDADDQLAPDFCEHLLHLAQKNQVDFVITNAYRLDSLGRQKSYFPLNAPPTVYSQQQKFQLGKRLSLLDPVWGKLFKRDLLLQNQIRFMPEIRFGEDTLFAHTVLLSTKKLAIDSAYHGYLYYDSIASSCSNSIQLQKRLHSLELLLRELDRITTPDQKFLLLRKSCEYLWSIKKFGEQNRKTLLQETRSSSLWTEILRPTIRHFGKIKHRLIVTLLQHGWLDAISLF